MADVGSTESRLEDRSGVADEHVTDAFGLLANETRLAILLAIYEAHDRQATDNSVAFSEILDRVGHDDPGNLRYHLEQLGGDFVRQRTERGGYELRFPAQKLVQALIAGAGVRTETLAPTEIDQSCPFCDACTTMSYQEGVLLWACTACSGMVPTDQDGPPGEGATAGPLTALPFDPGGLSDWTAEELRAVTMVLGARKIRAMFNGICPTCSGPVESWFDWCADHDPADPCTECERRYGHRAAFQCRTCEYYLTALPQRLALLHPAVISFYDAHGVSTRVRADDFEHAKEVYDRMLDHQVELVAKNPARVAVTVSLDGEMIRLLFDETVHVVDVVR